MLVKVVAEVRDLLDVGFYVLAETHVVEVTVSASGFSLGCFSRRFLETLLMFGLTQGFTIR